MQSIGLLGLGIMGTAMGRRLTSAGYSLVVWNRTAERCRELVAAGAIEASSPAEVVERCSMTLAIVSDPQASKELCFGPGGVLETMAPGKAYIDLSTVDPDTARAVGMEVTARGGRFLEAPVSGSKRPAEEGTLVILAAGDRSLYEEAGPIFEILGKLSLFLGDTGNGATMKLVVNMVMGTMMEALCEGVALAERAGLSATELLRVLDAGALSNPMFRLKGPKILAGDFEPAFPLKHAQKDLRLALELGERCEQPLPAAAAANESFQRARELGFADADFSAVARASLTARG